MANGGNDIPRGIDVNKLIFSLYLELKIYHNNLLKSTAPFNTYLLLYDIFIARLYYIYINYRSSSIAFLKTFDLFKKNRVSLKMTIS